MMGREYDILVIGGGPAGMAAAIHAASEGLNVCLIDAGNLGGQASESASIENFPGFHESITGADLMSRMIRQARKFNANIRARAQAHGLVIDGDWRVVTTDDFQEFRSRAVILSVGLTYRLHPAPGISELLNCGVFYGKPALFKCPPSCVTAVAGAGNSAGQAVLKLAENPRAVVRLVVRKTLAAQMSTYLIDRIMAKVIEPGKKPGQGRNIILSEHTEIVEARGKQRLTTLVVEGPDGQQELPTDFLFLYIGAVPKTYWLKQSSVSLSDKNFIKTGQSVCSFWRQHRQPMTFETSVPGVFAAGDARDGSTKRIAAAAGEGVAALAMCHSYLNPP